MKYHNMYLHFPSGSPYISQKSPSQLNVFDFVRFFLFFLRTH